MLFSQLVIIFTDPMALHRASAWCELKFINKTKTKLQGRANILPLIWRERRLEKIKEREKKKEKGRGGRGAGREN